MIVHILVASAVGAVVGVGLAYVALCRSGEHSPSW
jgi:hypothetical protein